MTFPLLTLLWLVPLVVAIGTAFAGARAKAVAMGGSLVTLALGIAAVAAYASSDGEGFQLTETHDWIAAFGVHYALGLDGLGVLLVALTVALVPIVLLAAWKDTDRPGFFAWVLALEALSLVVFTATDVFLFYVVFEATLIPAYFLIGSYGRQGSGGAALKFLMYQLGGGLVMLASVIGLYVVSTNAGAPSYLIDDLSALDISDTAQKWLFVGFFIGFAVKAPIFPLHTWLADTTEKATPPTSVLLVCILDKIGTFGMLRFCLGLLPDASDWATPVVVVLALISIVYGAFLAIGQDDVLRLIGLTSLSHFGFIVLGIFTLTPEGGSGSVLYMVNHGVATAALFLAAGFLVKRRGTTLISEMTGVESRAPMLAGLFLVAGLATAGLPGLSQFVSEIMVMIGAFDYHWLAGAVSVTGIVLAAIYVLWAYQRIFTGAFRGGPGLDTPSLVPFDTPARPSRALRTSPHEGYSTDVETDGGRVASAGGPGDGGRVASASEAGDGGRVASASERIETPDLGRREIGVLAPLTLALVLFGFVPGPLLEVANPTVEQLIEHVGVHQDGPTVDTADDHATEEGH